ncbi:MAG: tRNA 4-thiouridine(8) synthase ThiI [Candidatus Methanomethylicota archaeon]|uniref:Probable tRNA sulfurtransferase n=1 Tax=Thermoproteota archaeon TaxID=2056631 RepID=A0A497ET76_9CREN|nr:MAG: tRNA 4-thiouridine(8) synthase ThiI [Candidatus Verstraetearchaeota archaeon]
MRSYKLKENVALVRYGEVFLKSPQVHRRFLNALSSNIRFYLERKRLEFERMVVERGRIYVYSDKPEEIAKSCCLVFGVTSSSPAIELSRNFSEIEEAVISLAAREVRDNFTFAVRASRELKDYPLTSLEIEKRLGASILNALRSLNVKVNLENPMVELGVEIRRRAAYVYAKTFKGVGGLPIGVEGKLVSLISGGIDSPVAAWLMLKRGAAITFLHLDLGGESRKRWLSVMNALSTWFSNPNLEAYFIPDYFKILEDVASRAGKMTCLACKRLMYRLAEALTLKSGAKGFVTGESIGQVASQTLDNLYALSSGIKVPIYRPLAGLDKEDIVKLAKEIGTFQASTSIKFECPYVPRKPETHVDVKSLLELEKELKLVEKANEMLKRVSKLQL